MKTKMSYSKRQLDMAAKFIWVHNHYLHHRHEQVTASALTVDDVKQMIIRDIKGYKKGDTILSTGGYTILYNSELNYCVECEILVDPAVAQDWQFDDFETITV